MHPILLRLSLLSVLTSVVCAGTCLAAPPPSLPDTRGVLHQPLTMGHHQAALLIFVATACPISNSYVPEINRLYSLCLSHRIAFYLINTDTDATSQTVINHAREYGIRALTLLDSHHRLARYAGATVTPEAVIYLPNGKKAYQGRIDDRYLDFGKSRAVATTHDLRAALDAIRTHKPVRHAQTKAVGCFI